MNNKNYIIKLAVSIVMIVFGIIILLGQLDIGILSEIFAEWYLLCLLAFISIALICAIVKKAPYWYITAFTLSGIYLAVSITLHIESLDFSNMFMTVPLAFGVGIMVAKIACEWKAKAMLVGFIISIASAFILSGTILKVSKYTLPAFFIFVGVIVFIYTLKKLLSKKNLASDENSYVTLKSNDSDILEKK